VATATTLVQSSIHTRLDAACRRASARFPAPTARAVMAEMPMVSPMHTEV
jgi:hypothetical protein